MKLFISFNVRHAANHSLRFVTKITTVLQIKRLFLAFLQIQSLRFFRHLLLTFSVINLLNSTNFQKSNLCPALNWKMNRIQFRPAVHECLLDIWRKQVISVSISTRFLFYWLNQTELWLQFCLNQANCRILLGCSVQVSSDIIKGIVYTTDFDSL